MIKKSALALLLLFLGGTALAQETPSPAEPRSERPASSQARPERGPGLSGTITALTDDQMTLRTFEGKTVTVKLTAETSYRKDRQPAKLADFKAGDIVMVRGEPTGENTRLAHAVLARSNAAGEFREGLGKRFIAGEIKAIDGTRLTILRMDGETQSIEVDDNTSFRKQGESITLADLKPGDRVSGRGEMKNGVFVPAMLNVGEFSRMRRGPAPNPAEPH